MRNPEHISCLDVSSLSGPGLSRTTTTPDRPTSRSGVRVKGQVSGTGRDSQQTCLHRWDCCVFITCVPRVLVLHPYSATTSTFRAPPSGQLYSQVKTNPSAKPSGMRSILQWYNFVVMLLLYKLLLYVACTLTASVKITGQNRWVGFKCWNYLHLLKKMRLS